MTKIHLDLSFVRVMQEGDEHGNPVAVVEVAGIPVLFASLHDLENSEHWKYLTSRTDYGELVLDTEMAADLIEHYLKSVLSRLLLNEMSKTYQQSSEEARTLNKNPETTPWTTSNTQWGTGRSVRHDDSRVTEGEDNITWLYRED